LRIQEIQKSELNWERWIGIRYKIYVAFGYGKTDVEIDSYNWLTFGIIKIFSTTGKQTFFWKKTLLVFSKQSSH
jgi:hypothetical protein